MSAPLPARERRVQMLEAFGLRQIAQRESAPTTRWRSRRLRFQRLEVTLEQRLALGVAQLGEAGREIAAPDLGGARW
jgi:hypothetical protein